MVWYGMVWYGMVWYGMVQAPKQVARQLLPLLLPQLLPLEAAVPGRRGGGWMGRQGEEGKGEGEEEVEVPGVEPLLLLLGEVVGLEAGGGAVEEVQSPYQLLHPHLGGRVGAEEEVGGRGGGGGPAPRHPPGGPRCPPWCRGSARTCRVRNSSNWLGLVQTIPPRSPYYMVW